MLILVSQLINQPVIIESAGSQIGRIGLPVINPENGKLLAFHLTTGLIDRLTNSNKLIDGQLIRDYSSQQNTLASSTVLQLSQEPKIREIIKSKIKVYGATVRTEGGNKLGQATDLLLDSELGIVIKYYVHSLLRDYVITAEEVITIDRRGIIVNDRTPKVSSIIPEIDGAEI